MQTSIITFATSPHLVLDRAVREAECALMTGISRSQRWKLEKQGRFPHRRRTSLRSHHWMLSEIMAWLDEPDSFNQKSATTSKPTKQTTDVRKAH